MDADLVFRSLVTLLHCELPFSKAKNLSNTYLHYDFDIILYTTEVNLLKNKSLKASFGLCISLLNDPGLFPEPSTLSQDSKILCSTEPRYDHQI